MITSSLAPDAGEPRNQWAPSNARTTLAHTVHLRGKRGWWKLPLLAAGAQVTVTTHVVHFPIHKPNEVFLVDTPHFHAASPKFIGVNFDMQVVFVPGCSKEDCAGGFL